MPSPTPEQTDIIEAAVKRDQNLMVNALAGTGKTSTIEMAIRAYPKQPILYIVFNRKNAEEAEKKLPSTTTVRTWNSLGHRVFAQAIGKKLVVNPKKNQDILREIMKPLKRSETDVIWGCFWEIMHGVSWAKSSGYVPDGKYPSANRLCDRNDFHSSLDEAPDDLVADLIDEVLHQSIQQAYHGLIDYDDQVYMPAVFGGPYPKYPLVVVDEKQDANSCNHAMLKKLVTDRFMGVGDPWQSIYGFRGAVQGGMAKVKAQFACKELDLSVSFRCPQAIVENARWRVPHYKWLKEGGHVQRLESIDGGDIPSDAVILCRNNAPLFKTALRLLATGRGVSVAGSDIGPKILGIMKKLGPGEMSRDELKESIEDWRQAKILKKSKSAMDIADCMLVFAEHGVNLDQAIRYAEHLFKQSGTIRLMTGHKAKGLEFDNVYFLDEWIISDDEQDLNLKYVIQTRSKDRLTYIDSTAINW